MDIPQIFSQFFDLPQETGNPDQRSQILRTCDSVITEQEDKETEKSHINRTLRKCGYPNWSLDKAVKPKSKTPTKGVTSNKTDSTESKGQVVLLYIKGVSEALKRTYSAYGIRVAFKPTQTLRQLLVSPKDKTEKKDTAGPIYYIRCQGQTQRSQCTESYINETERSLKTRFLEHRSPSSTSSEVSQHIHIESPDHHVELEEVKILDREQRYFERGVKEAIYIRVNQPSLNKDWGWYKLPRVYDPILGSHVRKICDLWSGLPVSWEGQRIDWKFEVCPNFCVEIMGLDSIFIPVSSLP